MKLIWEVGSGQYDLYDTHAFCETEEQAHRVSEAIGRQSYVTGPVTLFETGDRLPQWVTVWSAWVDDESESAESQEVMDYEVRPESVRWGAGGGGRAHHQPTREAALAAARAVAGL